MQDVWSPLTLSLLIAGGATLLVAIAGIPIAWLLSRRSFPGRRLVEAVLMVPLVLPPTVVGYFLIVLLGVHGWIGRWVSKILGPIVSPDTHKYSLLFRPEGGVIAAAVVAFPLLYLPVKNAFASVDKDLEDVATVMGAGKLGVFWHVSLPLARRGIVGGVLLSFGRAVGEYGATTMVMGSTDRWQTLPIAIYNWASDGDLGAAAGAVWALTAVSLGIVLLCNRPGLYRRE
jgi:molybdate transport system permease protein